MVALLSGFIDTMVVCPKPKTEATLGRLTTTKRRLLTVPREQERRERQHEGEACDERAIEQANRHPMPCYVSV